MEKAKAGQLAGSMIDGKYVFPTDQFDGKKWITPKSQPYTVIVEDAPGNIVLKVIGVAKIHLEMK
jgi:hypothetical protein